MRIWLTGTIRLEGAAGPVPQDRLPGRQGRLLLAYLVTEHDRAVRRDELAELLWAEDPPATWEKSIAVAISKLRSTLGAAGIDGARALTNAFGCYQLSLPEGTWLDTEVAGQRAHDAEAALRTGRLDEALRAAREAAELARNPFLTGEEGDWVTAQRAGLRAVLLRALETSAAAALQAEDPAAALAAAQEAVSREPFREASHRQLMQAHALAGNRAAALQAFEQCRTLLVDELGVDPDPQTEAVYLDILRTAPHESGSGGSATRDAPPPPAPAPRSRFPTWVAISAPVAAAVVVIAVLIATHHQAAPTTSIRPNSLAAIDPGTGRVLDEVGVGARPGDVVAAAGSLWVANLGDGTVSEVDAQTGTLDSTIVAGADLSHLAADGGSVWLSTTAGAVDRIDPAFGTLSTIAHVVKTHWLQDPPHAIAAHDGVMWAADPGGQVDLIDLASGRLLGTALVGQDADAVAADGEGAWVANASDGTVSRIDRTGAVVATIPVGHGPIALALSPDAVWVTDSLDDRVVRIDPRTNVVVASIPVGRGPASVAVTGNAVWVGNAQSGSLSRIDARTNRVTDTVALKASPGGLSFADGRLWVTAGPLAVTPSGGGVLRLDIAADPSSLDPALSYDPIGWQLEYATCAKLLNYPDLPAPGGYVLRPEVAESVPRPSADGRTYRFVVRPGFRFAAPSNAPVTAQTFADSIERVLSPAMKSPGAQYAADIEGAAAFMAGKARHVSGIVVSGNALTFHLIAAAPDFPERISMPFFCAVPAGTPPDPHLRTPPPGAGPYSVVSYTPGQQIVLRANPNYHGSRSGRFTEIVYSIGIGAQQSLRQVTSGRADYVPDALPVSAYPNLETRYGQQSAAARTGRQRYFVNTSAGIRYLMLNTARPLFSNPRLRRAVNYAIDRPALTEQQRRFFTAFNYGGGIPTSGYLPPGFLSYPRRSPYPLDGPDLATARRLAGDEHGVARLYTCNESPCPEQAQIIKTDLAAIGIRVAIFAFPKPIMFAKIESRNPLFDITTIGWGTDYPDPSGFLNALLDGAQLKDPGNNDYSLFDSPQVNAQLRAAARLGGPARYETYGRLADQIAKRAAPMVAYSTDTVRDFFSARIGCQEYQPVYGMDLTTLCLRSS